jgi:hypothetical protein
MFGICKGCSTHRKLIKAHVIPAAFFKDLNEKNPEPLRMYTDTKGVYPKRTPIGIYDPQILCEECERIFQDLDCYASNVLVNRIETKELLDGGKSVGFLLMNVDVSKLEKFMASVLWRASVSSLDFFRRVALGPYESKFRQLVWSTQIENATLPSFILSKFDGVLGKGLVLDPHQERWFGIKYYRVYFGSYISHIKVDQRAPPSQFDYLDSRRSGRNLLVISKDIKQSREWRLAQRILQAFN